MSLVRRGSPIQDCEHGVVGEGDDLVPLGDTSEQARRGKNSEGAVVRARQAHIFDLDRAQ